MMKHTGTGGTDLSRPCPACGGPLLHPGTCVDGDGYVLPAYASLAHIWEEQGRPPLTAEEIADMADAAGQWPDRPEAGFA